MADKAPGGETDIIRRYFAPLAEGAPGAFALRDDAGLMEPPGDRDIVLTTDMIVGGVHYLETAAPRDVAYKALAVNVSDLCAKGAEPAVYLLSLAMPSGPDADWLAGLREGFAEAQDDFGCKLLGGDTVLTPGPAAISVTAAGFVPRGGMVHRFGAREGDLVYVTGTIGDAALGLALLTGTGGNGLTADQADFLLSRHRRPRPRLDAIPVLRKYANAAMDVSDGLAGDFARMCGVSETGGVIDATDVPLSAAAAAWLEREPERLRDVLTGGDDYEVLLTVSEKNVPAFERDCAARGLQIARIGRIASRDDGVRVLGGQGRELKFSHPGYEHF